MDLLGVVAVDLWFLADGVAEGQQGERVLVVGQVEDLADFLNAVRDGGNGHHDAAEAEFFELEPEVFGGDGAVDVGDAREDDVLAGGDDEHDGGFSSRYGIGARLSKCFNRLALRHDIEFPGLLVARRRRDKAGLQQLLDFLFFHGSILEFADARAGEDGVHDIISFLCCRYLFSL